MSFINFFSSTSFDHLSVEANSDGFPLQYNQYHYSSDTNFDDLFSSDILANGIEVSGTCNSSDLTESINRCYEPNEFDKYLGPEHLTNLMSDIDQDLLVLNTLPIQVIDKNKKVKSNKKQILLSSSVGVGVPRRSTTLSHKIEIVNDLEKTYRPRYKSDYFSQGGKLRKPRYVADREGNHYISLKVNVDTRGKWIRVDWVTIPDDNGNRYYMPYRFQGNNDSVDVPDCNPIYQNIELDSEGKIRLYLVLIKSKQDALKSLQPLQPFHPMRDALGFSDKQTPEKMDRLTPKKLIQKYQLGKSQLAFTLCTVSTTGDTYIPVWDTTEFSTVLEEEATDGLTTKTIACPNCSCEITIDDDNNTNQEITTNKRKCLKTIAEKPKTIKKQRSFPETPFFAD